MPKHANMPKPLDWHVYAAGMFSDLFGGDYTANEQAFQAKLLRIELVGLIMFICAVVYAAKAITLFMDPRGIIKLNLYSNVRPKGALIVSKFLLAPKLDVIGRLWRRRGRGYGVAA